MTGGRTEGKSRGRENGDAGDFTDVRREALPTRGHYDRQTGEIDWRYLHTRRRTDIKGTRQMCEEDAQNEERTTHI